ncbi:hypothetical protein EVJ58_g11049 [Rhodofomes roseus]|uniref:Uncharacterized protein n=1 Tax=Rhodofomes roseus TaxID=34475 RepID=A0A4Y9XL59_9APHY|nr:hypothetical protein EVJ58_g11049 [Rhodofomes roseus]
MFDFDCRKKLRGVAPVEAMDNLSRPSQDMQNEWPGTSTIRAAPTLQTVEDTAYPASPNPFPIPSYAAPRPSFSAGESWVN